MIKNDAVVWRRNKFKRRQIKWSGGKRDHSDYRNNFCDETSVPVSVF